MNMHIYERQKGQNAVGEFSDVKEAGHGVILMEKHCN